ncbi:hypothetical protein BT93_L3173 [Corymbia citriodora subsp. variegata]|uniref:Uncharacterized protein n=1 Tax=Corymbia citriodora subsp. variegata TaxID=360336 RepID=A0A8T0CHS4_CORYI|nr:hypothetical protein BT93_L3173 [Corymbia citriodora subsp. variegata]
MIARQYPDNSVKYKICKNAACLDNFTRNEISGKSIAFCEHAELSSLPTINHPKQELLNYPHTRFW